MGYLTTQEYDERFGAEERAEVLATDPSLTLEAAIRDAESIVDSYLAAVPNRTYSVPLVVGVPSRIVELTADLARYEIHAKKVTHEIKRRRDQAIEFLRDLVKGLAVIPDLSPGGGDPVDTGGATAIAEPRVFDSCTLRGYLGR